MNGAVADWSEEKTNEPKDPRFGPRPHTWLVVVVEKRITHLSSNPAWIFLLLVFQLHLFFVALACH